MKKMELKRQRLLKQAKDIFTDSDNYTDEELIGYSRLTNMIATNEELTQNSVTIAGLKEDLKILTDMQQQIIDLHLFQNLSYAKISPIFSLTRGRIQQIEAKGLGILRTNLHNFSTKRVQEIIAAKSNLINEILSVIPNRTDFDISKLGLSQETCEYLEVCGIKNLSKLLLVSEKDLYNSFYNQGYLKKIINEITEFKIFFNENRDVLEKRYNLIYAKTSNPSSLKFKYDYSIKLLSLTTRTYNGLYRKGIYTVSELLALTENELRYIRNIGKHSIEEIFEVQRKLWNGEM